MHDKLTRLETSSRLDGVVDIGDREHQLVIVGWKSLSEVTNPATDRCDAFAWRQIRRFLEISFQTINTECHSGLVGRFCQAVRVQEQLIPPA